MSVDLQQPSEVPVRTHGPFALAMRRRAATIGFFLAAIWVVWLADALLFQGSLQRHGVVPRTLGGLFGILWAPFLHGSWSHVMGNSVGILVLGGLLILRSEDAFWAVSILGALSAGLGTWLIGRGNAVHIGASGVIFAYFGYLLFAGIFERRVGSLILSVVVFLLWGGMLWSALPFYSAAAISWEGHLCGFVGGALTAKLLAKPSPA